MSSLDLSARARRPSRQRTMSWKDDNYASMKRTSRLLSTHNVSNTQGQIEVRDPDIMRLCYDKDESWTELRQLAIRIQKNGGVDVGDHRKNGQTYRRCLKIMELVSWLVDTFGLSRDLACLICKELWKHGLIWNAENSYSAFSVNELTFFRVAHPYAINLLLLPSEMEQVYSEARDKTGPKRVDKFIGGRHILACFPSAELIDWAMSVHHINPRERAVQVVQQMANEGYFFNVDGTTQIVDGPNVFMQHKHDYTGNIVLSKRRMCLIATEIAKLYESCVQSEYGGKRPVATVALVASLIESIIEDCSFQKAKFVLLQMKKAKFAQINNRSTHSATSASSSQSRWSYRRLLDGVERWTQVGQDFNLLKELGRDDDPVMIKLDDQFHNLKARFSHRGPSGLVYPDTTHTEDDISDAESHVPLVMNVTKGRNELVEQNLAVTLMSHLGGGVVSAKVGGFSRESARTKTVRMVIHLLFCLVLAIEVLANTQSVLGLTEGLKKSIAASAGFEQATSKHEFIDWVRDQVATEFSWRGTQFPLLEPPAILVGGPTHYTGCDELQQLVTSAARRAAEHSDFDTHIPVVRADADDECWVNEETHAIGTENTYAPAAYLLTCMQNPAKCTSELEGLDAELSLDSKSILVDRMALEVVLLGYKAEPPLIVKVTAQAKFSAVANDVHVRFMHVSNHAGHSATEFVLIILIVCVTLDFIVLTCRRGRAFLFDVSRIFHLARIALPCVALRMQFVFEKDLYAYLSSVTWNNAPLYQPNASNAGFDVLHQQKDAARLYFIIAMFLAAMTVPSYIGGAKYNIFALLQQTLRTVQGDVKVLAITFFITFCGFVATMYAIMNSLSSLFASPGSTGMIMYGSLFGGAPWNTFLEIRGASRLLSAVGFIAMATYLFLFIIILLNMFVAIILQSYQTQKRDEAVLRAEFIRHLHASEGTSDISTLKASLGERLYEVAEVTEPHRTNFKVTLQRTIKSITERLRTSAKVHHDGSFISQSTSEIFADEKGEKTSLSRQASAPAKAMPRQDSKIVRKTPPALVKQGSVGVNAQGALPRKLQQLL